MNYKYITVSFGALRKITGPPLQWQYNEKQYLVINGLDLPDVYAVDFMNQGDTQTITMTPTEEGVLIPDQFLLDARPLIAYIVVVDGESVNTIAQITFPVNPRGARTDMSPEPAEQQQIDQLIATMNEAVENAADSAEESERQAGISGEHATDSEAWAVGQRGGEDVPDTDSTYHNNSKYYAGRAEAAAAEAGQHEASCESWVRRAESAADDAEGSARDAAGSKADAEAAAQTATQKATEAGNSATAAAGSAASARQTVDGGVGAINTARDGALSAIGQAGMTQVNAVNQAGASQVTAVNQAGTTQAQAVEDKGAEVLDSIPQDYSELVDDVADLARHLSDKTTGLDAKAPVILETASGAIANFDDGADSMPIRKIVATIEPVQSGTGDPSPVNKRPITGWTGAEIWGGGINILDENDPGKENCTITNTGDAITDKSRICTGFIPCKSDAITYSCGIRTNQTGNPGNSNFVGIAAFDSHKNYLGRKSANYASLISYKLPKGTCYIRAFEQPGGAAFIVQENFWTEYKRQLEIGESATAFTLPSGQQISVNWEDKAGTVYGGEDEVISGKLKSTMNIVNMGDIDWIKQTGGGVSWFAKNMSSLSKPMKPSFTTDVTTALLSCYDYIGFGYISSLANGKCITNGNIIYIRDDSCATPEDFISKVTGQMLCYELAEPVEYTLTGNEMTTLYGTNNVWCDTGDITELVYPVDTTAAIDAGDAENASAISTLSGSLATVETTSTSSKAYAIDDLLVYNSQLYKVASVIAAGGTLTPGTNITDTTVEEQIAEVKTELDKDIADVQAQISNVAGLQVLDWETIGYSYSVTSGGHKVSRNGNHIRTGETGTTTTGKWVVNLFGGNISIISNSSSVNGAILASEKLPLPTIASDSDVEIVIHEKWQSRVSGGYRRPPYIYVATVSSEDVVERMDITWSSTSLEGDYFKSYSLRKQLPSAFTNGNIVLCMGVNNAQCLTDVWFDVHIVHTQT